MGLADTLKNIKDAQDESTQAGTAIGDKMRMIQQYKDATAPAPAAKPSAPAKPSPQDMVNPSAKYGGRPGEKRIDVKKLVVGGSFKKGGKVKKTGIYKLHAKERVLNAKQTAKVAKKGGLAAILGGKA